ncbi:RNA polymerase sigma factor [candidate division KSB1 bacterium]
MKICKDEELIRNCASGDTEAFDLLFKKYAKPLTHFIYNIIYDRDRAEDIFQDTFLKVYENSGKFNDKFKFSTWIYRIALNLSINELKRIKRQSRFWFNPAKDLYDKPETDFLDSFSDHSDPEEILEKKETEEQIKFAIERLPGTKKVAFILKFYQHLSYEEIANIMDCSVGTVKSRIHYAIEKLQILVGN